MSTLCGTPAWLLWNTRSNGRPAGTISDLVSNDTALLAEISGTAGTATGVGVASGGVRLLRKPMPVGASISRKLITMTAPYSGTSRRGQTARGSRVLGTACPTASVERYSWPASSSHPAAAMMPRIRPPTSSTPLKITPSSMMNMAIGAKKGHGLGPGMWTPAGGSGYLSATVTAVAAVGPDGMSTAPDPCAGSATVMAGLGATTAVARHSLFASRSQPMMAMIETI